MLASNDRLASDREEKGYPIKMLVIKTFAVEIKTDYAERGRIYIIYFRSQKNLALCRSVQRAY